MMRPSFDKLPLLVLETISEFIEGDDLEPGSLLSFALVSRYFEAVTARQRFRHLRLHIPGDPKRDIINTCDIHENVARWIAILRDERQRYVKKITICRAKQPNPYGKGITANPTLYGDEHTAVELFAGLLREPSPTQEDKHIQDRLWLPLFYLVEQLPGVRDVVWVIRNQIPISILKALERRRVRIHHYTFCLRSLNCPGEPISGIDVDERALALSPSLHSITIPYANILDCNPPNHNSPATCEMIQGLTTNLKIVRVINHLSRWVEPTTSAKLPWAGLQAQHQETIMLGRLTSLSLETGISCDRTLNSWSKLTDFTLLQTLTLCNEVDINGLRLLYRMAHDQVFASLQNLTLNVRNFRGDSTEEFDIATASIVSRLRPLRSVHLTGAMASQAFQAVLEQHGMSLQKLTFKHIRPRFQDEVYFQPSASRILELSSFCPGLEELEMVVMRTQGNAEEVQLYRAFGTLKKLRLLTLSLNCANFLGYDRGGSTWKGTDQQWDEHCRICMINTAVDSSLAVSICKLASAKDSHLKVLNLNVDFLETPVCNEIFLEEF